MISPSNKSGFTLLEALVSLTLMSTVLAIVVVLVRSPSPVLKAEAAATALVREAALMRKEAISRNEKVTWTPDAPACDETVEGRVEYFPNGMATGPNFCVAGLELRVHPLTGLLQRVAQ